MGGHILSDKLNTDRPSGPVLSTLTPKKQACCHLCVWVNVWAANAVLRNGPAFCELILPGAEALLWPVKCSKLIFRMEFNKTEGLLLTLWIKVCMFLPEKIKEAIHIQCLRLDLRRGLQPPQYTTTWHHMTKILHCSHVMTPEAAPSADCKTWFMAAINDCFHYR